MVDPVAIQSLIGAQGPVDAGGRALDENDVLGFLPLGQYDGIGPDDEQGRRRDELSTVARAAVDALRTRPWNTSRLVGRLSEAGRGRHVLAWSRDPTEQRAWVAGGIAGTLHYDSLLVSVMNFAGNKLDQFLAVDAFNAHLRRLRLDPRPPGRVRVVDAAKSGAIAAWEMTRGQLRKPAG